MSREIHYQKLANMYALAKSQEAYTREIQISEGKASLILPVKPEYCHAAGAVHGHVYFKVMDDAAFFAAASLVDDVFVLTVSFQVYFTRPISEGSLHAEGKVVHHSRNLILAESVVSNDKGKQIAGGSGSFMRSRSALDPKIGYRLDP